MELIYLNTTKILYLLTIEFITTSPSSGLDRRFSIKVRKKKFIISHEIQFLLNFPNVRVRVDIILFIGNLKINFINKRIT